MSSTRQPVVFDAMDECHRQIHQHLASLDALAQRMEANEIDATMQAQAGAIEAYFSGTSRQHHADEERLVFPPLLASSNPDLVSAVRNLQQDHGWIEENWIALAPQLRAIAQGHHWVDLSEFHHAAAIFHDLCAGHIALEESLVYPESKARWAEALALRVTPERMAAG